jgi:hypothetical protein
MKRKYHPCQLFVVPETNGGTFYIYDICQNTFTASSFGSTPVTDTTDFGEVCSDGNWYSIDSGAYIYTPATAVSAANPIMTGPGTWTSITGVPPPTRSYAGYVKVPYVDLNTAGFVTGCSGC